MQHYRVQQNSSAAGGDRAPNQPDRAFALERGRHSSHKQVHLALWACLHPFAWIRRTAFEITLMKSVSERVDPTPGILVPFAIVCFNAALMTL